MIRLHVRAVSKQRQPFLFTSDPEQSHGERVWGEVSGWIRFWPIFTLICEYFPTFTKPFMIEFWDVICTFTFICNMVFFFHIFTT